MQRTSGKVPVRTKVWPASASGMAPSRPGTGTTNALRSRKYPRVVSCCNCSASAVGAGGWRAFTSLLGPIGAVHDVRQDQVLLGRGQFVKARQQHVAERVQRGGVGFLVVNDDVGGVVVLLREPEPDFGRDAPASEVHPASVGSCAVNTII